MLDIFYVRTKKSNVYSDSIQLNLILCVLSTESNVLKPSIKFDSRLRKSVNIDISVDIGYIQKTSTVKPEFL